MSKIKIIDLNKQLKTRSKETVEKMEALQTSVQSHLATLKRIDAELIQIVRAEAEEKRLKLEQEKAVELAKEAAVAQMEKEQKEQAAKEKASVEKEPVVDEKPKAENVVKTEKETALEAKPETDKATGAAEQPKIEITPAKASGFQKPQGQRPQDQRPQGQRPQNQSGNYQPPQGQTPQGQSGNYQRPQGQRPQGQSGNYQRPQGQRPQGQSGNYQRPQGQRPQGQSGNYQRPQGQRPQGQSGNYQRPQGQRPQGQSGNYQRPQGQRPQGQTGGYQRPTGQRPQGQTNTRNTGTTSGFVHVDKKNNQNKKHGNNYNRDDRSRRSKKIKEKGVFEYNDRYRSKRRVKKPVAQIAPIIVENAVMTTEMISVKSLAEKTGKPVAALLKKLLLLGMMCTINSELDFDTAQLICSEFKITLEYKLDKTAEDVLDEGHAEDKNTDLQNRPPIVTIMGHVDHGKTSLLDAIRETRITEHEAGGITQHIGAYTINHNGHDITFLDTPGHEAFTAMRARGAQVTDIAILVVAADDGVMPQTIEAINHAKAAGVPIIVAINKIDRPNANPEKIKQELTEHELVTEDWGGDTVMVPVSAITKEGLDQLLEMIVLVSEVGELKANPDRLAKGTIVEAKLDKGRGPVATVLVQNGTLRIQDMIVAGVAYGRVRAMVDDMGNRVEEAGPSQPVEVVGFSEVPTAGDILHAVEQDKLSRQVAEERKDKQKASMLKNLSKVSLDDLFGQVEEGKLKDLNIVIKADVQGSVEAVRQALEKLKNDEVRVKVIHAGVGAIKAMDVMLASASNAIIIGFNVRPDSMARVEADKEKVEMRLYRVIYKAIEDIELAMKGMLAPEFKEVVLGHAEVRTIFNVSSIGTIAGSYVTDGKITKTSSVRLLRDNIVVHEGVLASLKRFKDDAKEVNQGYECGITIKNYNDVKEGDVIEAFEMQEIER